MYDQQLWTEGELLIELPRGPVGRMRLMMHLETKFPRMRWPSRARPTATIHSVSHIMLTQDGLWVYGHHRGTLAPVEADWYTGRTLSYQDVVRELVSHNNS